MSFIQAKSFVENKSFSEGIQFLQMKFSEESSKSLSHLLSSIYSRCHLQNTSFIQDKSITKEVIYPTSFSKQKSFTENKSFIHKMSQRKSYSQNKSFTYTLYMPFTENKSFIQDRTLTEEVI